MHNSEQREFLLAIAGGMALSFNSGYINGCCISGFDGENHHKDSVAGMTGAYTKSGLGAGAGDSAAFSYPLGPLACFVSINV